LSRRESGAVGVLQLWGFWGGSGGDLLLRRRPNASWRAVLEAARIKAELESQQISA